MRLIFSQLVIPLKHIPDVVKMPWHAAYLQRDFYFVELINLHRFHSSHELLMRKFITL